MTDLKITKDNNNICVYERLNDDCIRLLHMYGKNPVCVVPDMLDGMRVTELAEYCFSFKSMPEKLKTELGIDDILSPDMTECKKLAGCAFIIVQGCLCLSCHPTYVMWMVTLS